MFVFVCILAITNATEQKNHFLCMYVHYKIATMQPEADNY